MPLTIERLYPQDSQNAQAADAIAFLLPNNTELIDDGTKLAIHTKFKRGEAIVMVAREDSQIVGASFSVIQKDSPKIAMYTYEAGSQEVRKELLLETRKAVGEDLGKNCPIFFEGFTAQSSIRKFDEERGFRRIKFDDSTPGGYQWCDGKYQWMVIAKKPPSLSEMEAAIYLQRNFIVLAMEPEKIETRLDMPLAKQIPKALHGDDAKGYGVDKAIEHARKMANEQGYMHVLPRLTPTFKRTIL